MQLFMLANKIGLMILLLLMMIDLIYAALRQLLTKQSFLSGRVSGTDVHTSSPSRKETASSA